MQNGGININDSMRMAVASAVLILSMSWLNYLFGLLETVENALSKSSRTRLQLMLFKVLCIHLLTAKGANDIVSNEVES